MIVAAMPEVRRRLLAENNQALDEGTDGYVIPQAPSAAWIAHREARHQSEIIQTYWTNFAETGNPNGPGVPLWQPYDAAGKASIEFAQNGPVPRKANRAAPCASFIAKCTRHPDIQSGGPDHIWYKGLGQGE